LGKLYSSYQLYMLAVLV